MNPVLKVSDLKNMINFYNIKNIKGNGVNGRVLKSDYICSLTKYKTKWMWEYLDNDKYNSYNKIISMYIEVLYLEYLSSMKSEFIIGKYKISYAKMEQTNTKTNETYEIRRISKI